MYSMYANKKFHSNHCYLLVLYPLITSPGNGRTLPRGASQGKVHSIGMEVSNNDRREK
jgi:hypothetical protein